MALQFDPTLSLAENLERLREEAERIDPECAVILFDNLPLLMRDSDLTRIRQASPDFYRAVLVALEAMPEGPTA